MGIEYGAVNLYSKYGRPSLDLQFSGLKASLTDRVGNVGVEFTRDTTGTYVDANGVIQTAASGEARFDHDPVTGESLGLLIEESRTNESPYSETFQDNGDDTGWRTSGGTVTPSAGTSPSNGAASSIDGSIYKRLNWGAAGTQNATSVYVKAGTGTTGTLSYQNSNGGGISFDLVAGTVTPVYTCDGTFIEDVGGGWFRIGFNRTSTSTLTALNLYLTTTPGETVLFWGAQVEKTATFSTSYIPTTSSTFTRGADVASMTGTNFSSWYNQSEGTIFTRGKLLANNINGDIVVLDSNNTVERIQVRIQNTQQLAVRTGNVNQALLDAGSVLDSFNSIAGAMKVNDFACALNGALATDNAGNVASPFQMRFFLSSPGGHISRITYWPTRLSDSDLQRLTE